MAFMTIMDTFLQMVCHWGLTVWSAASWPVSGVARSLPCSDVCRSSSKVWGSTLLSISWTCWALSTTSAKVSSILYSLVVIYMVIWTDLDCVCWSTIYEVQWDTLLSEVVTIKSIKNFIRPRMSGVSEQVAMKSARLTYTSLACWSNQRDICTDSLKIINRQCPPQSKPVHPAASWLRIQGCMSWQILDGVQSSLLKAL